MNQQAEHSTQYRLHLRSAYWANLRRDALLVHRWRCARCDMCAYDLQLHHITYDTLGHETLEDVELLCPPCHRRADIERERTKAARRYAARLDGWATKIYGEDWNHNYEQDEIADAFDDWVAIRDDTTT